MTDLDTKDIKDRSERGRGALLKALADVPDDVFIVDPDEEEWSAARNLRHVVWVEYFWTMAAVRARNTAAGAFDLNREISLQIANDASRLAGTPGEELAKPPPYATKTEAVTGLEDSRRRFWQTIEALTFDDLQKPITAPWGALSVRWALEHIVEHDWAHAVQLTALCH